MSHAPTLTLQQRLAGGPPVRHGHSAGYRRLVLTGGEPHLVRPDLAGQSVAAALRSSQGQRPDRRGLLALAHLTDLQLADVQSPTRFEFFHHRMNDPRFAKLVPVHRPQEALTAHSARAMIDTLNRLHEHSGTPLTGSGLSLAVTTGDAIDNAQWNELRAFLALMDGGLVRMKRPGTGYRGVQSLDWPDDIFWRPDGDGLAGPDLFRAGYAFGHRPGLIEAALADFRTGGLRLPWLACYGNHEALIQGVAVVTPELAEVMVGDRKPTRMPAGLDLEDALEVFTARAHTLIGTDLHHVDADPDRRPISRSQFVEAHFSSGAQPDGHGFSSRNRLDGTAYYCHDVDAERGSGVRLIALDTTCLTGSADGCVDPGQYGWLERALAEVHSAYTGADGSPVRTGNPDRLVILFSHHGLDTLTSTRTGLTVDGAPALGGPALLALLHRFPNVVLWLNGHTHTNGVRARPNPHQPGRGFWEVTTCAIVDWPCQSRIVELIDEGEGVLSIACTMIDHEGAVVPDEGKRLGPRQLAGLHREIAGNVPWAGFDSHHAGTPSDRNVILPLRAPFSLR